MVELHVTTLSTPPGGPRGPPEHVPRPGQGRVHIVDSIPTRVNAPISMYAREPSFGFAVREPLRTGSGVIGTVPPLVDSTT